MKLTHMLKALGINIKQESEQPQNVTKTCSDELPTTTEILEPKMEKKITKSCNMVKKEKRTRHRIYTKMVLNEDLSKEIKRAQNRLTYLKRRKADGKPTGTSGKYVTRTAKKGEEDELYVFYREHILDGSFEKLYNSLRENMIKHSKMFTNYHNKVHSAIKKYGNAKMMENFDNMCHIERLDIKL